MTVHSNGKDVASTLQDMANGVLHVVIGARYPFQQLPNALDRLEQGGVAGKIVVESPVL